MKTQPPMSEETMLRMEARIPELAGQALRQAYDQALAVSGQVIEARNGQLLETTSDGQQRVIRNLTKPFPIQPGTKRFREPRA